MAQDRREVTHGVLIFSVTAFLITAVGVVLWIAIVLYYPKPEDRAAFGNMFGGINTLFAGFGFAGLIFTLLLQRQSLAHQQQAATEQQAEIAVQNRRIAQQIFEGSFFQLLTLHHAIVEQTVVNNAKGHLAFENMYGDMRNCANWATGQASELGDQVERAYEELHKRCRGTLDHYFRNLYHIIKFVDQSAPEAPGRYTSIVRAQLSTPELLLLLYNGASKYGEKFKPLIEKYALLEHLPDDVLTQPAHKGVYARCAFGTDAATGG